MIEVVLLSLQCTRQMLDIPMRSWRFCSWTDLVAAGLMQNNPQTLYILYINTIYLILEYVFFFHIPMILPAFSKTKNDTKGTSGVSLAKAVK